MITKIFYDREGQQLGVEIISGEPPRPWTLWLLPSAADELFYQFVAAVDAMHCDQDRDNAPASADDGRTTDEGL